MSKPKTKRFYKTVSTTKADAGWAVLLDGRTLKTPGKLPLITKTEKHAALIAAEWDAQTEVIRPHLMPVTRIYNVALERTPENREMIVVEVAKYAGTDLLCYRSKYPQVLAERQAENWDVWLEWARTKGIDLQTVQGVTALEQDTDALNEAAKLANQFEDLELTLLGHLNTVYGSAILALAVMHKALTAEEAYDVSRVDFEFQAENWGEDEEARALSMLTRVEVLALSKLI